MFTCMTDRSRSDPMSEPTINSPKMLEECDPIGGSQAWLIKPQNSSRMADLPTHFTSSMVFPANIIYKTKCYFNHLLAD